MSVRKPRPSQWQNRIVEYGEMTADELRANPQNWRIHNAQQQSAAKDLLDEVGWVGPLIVNRATGLIVDGHMRVNLAREKGPIPIAFVELTPDEERKVLLLLDPISAMAEADTDMVAALVAETELTANEAAALDGLLADEPEQVEAGEPETIQLKPMTTAHVLVSVPIDQWDTIAGLLDQLAEVPDVTVQSAVN